MCKSRQSQKGNDDAAISVIESDQSGGATQTAMKDNNERLDTHEYQASHSCDKALRQMCVRIYTWIYDIGRMLGTYETARLNIELIK